MTTDRVVRALKATRLESILDASPEGYTTDDEEQSPKPLGDTVEVMRMVELENENRNLKAEIDEIRNLNKHINDIREDERKRVACDIHDDLGQRLTAINLGLHWLTNVCQAEAESERSEILSLIKMNSEIIESVQRIACRLRPELLDDVGLGAALGWLISDLGRFGGPTFTLEYEVDKSILLPDVSLALFRITQECISNILKHSQATQAQLTVRIKDNSILFSMSDNGIGINSAKDHTRRSMGLVGMRERIHHLGGTFSISGGAGFGTRVEIVIPFSPALRSSNG